MKIGEKNHAFKMILDLLKAHNSSALLDEWAEEYHHTLAGRKYADQYRNAVIAAVDHAEAILDMESHEI